MTVLIRSPKEQHQHFAQQAAGLFKCLSHPDRLLLMCQLSKGQACVGELAALTGIKQPSLSQQLGILREQCLVDATKRGRQMYYQIASDDALAVMQLLFERFCCLTQATL